MKLNISRLIFVSICCLSHTSTAAEDGAYPPPEKQVEEWYAKHAKGAGLLLDETPLQGVS